MARITHKFIICELCIPLQHADAEHLLTTFGLMFAQHGYLPRSGYPGKAISLQEM
ncbi:hypothetical protein Q9233_000709 [Columba guinea]|nr:hypothetical protein Q9233_000709 [Columba guinea]